jgi:hypothetical protein
MELWSATQRHDYLAVRWSDGTVTGVNSRLALLNDHNLYPIDDTETRFVSYHPISFQEYIRIKTPFK